MRQEQSILRVFVTCEAFFPNSPEDTQSKIDIYDKLSKLIESFDRPQNVKFRSNRKKRSIVLLADDEFEIRTKCLKKLSTEVSLANPDKNLDAVNHIWSSVINYINAVLGDAAKGAKIATSKVTCKEEKPSNLSKKIIGETRLAKINENVKRSLSPLGIVFEYEHEGRRYMLALYSKRPAETIYSYETYKEQLPFDLINIEYEKLDEPESRIKDLYQVKLEI